ncbi:ankyrin repeat containing protein, putative [Babesia ovis]|uniref:Ankyrin repeat containing protein, putative n=1 Tax=Babesia ovis TaxID=5869 RepID=A0A9W5WWA3_BABOV|nr:ankyrin repeat containing protein, putative [Babesia ovis]
MFENFVNLVAGVGQATNEGNKAEAAHRSTGHGDRRRRERSDHRNATDARMDEEIETKINDMLHIAKTEERVSRYLERMQKDHTSGKFQRIDTEATQDQKNTSWEHLHKSQAHNRHVYFGGAPLGNCIEILNLKRREALLRKETVHMAKQLHKRDVEIEALLERQNTDFQKFEMALGKAVSLGGGCARLAEILTNHCTKMKRYFFKRVRRRQVNYLQSTIEAQAELIRQKHKLAIMVITRLSSNMLSTPLKDALIHWRTARIVTPKLNLPLKGKKVVPTKRVGSFKGQITGDHRKWKPDTEKLDDNFASVEESLLSRLENLVAEEMQMLTTSSLVQP